MKSLEKRFKEIMMKHLQTNSAYTVTLSGGLYWELLKAVEDYYRTNYIGFKYSIMDFNGKGKVISCDDEGFNKFLSNLREK